MSEITLICETCGQPITGSQGSIYIRIGDVGAHREAERQWREIHPVGTALDIAALALMPEDIRWRTGHDACRTDNDQDCYDIDAARISTWPRVAWWTAHLLEKNWLQDSDWDDVLRELSGEAPSCRVRGDAREAA